MQEPKIFSLSRIEISEMSITLPNNATVVLKRGGEYRTSDEEEIAFLCTVKGVQCRDISDAEYKTWAQTQFEKMAHIDNPEIKTVEDVAQFLWKDPVDKLILLHLENNGYIVSKKEDVDELHDDKHEELNEVPAADTVDKPADPEPKPKRTRNKSVNKI